MLNPWLSRDLQVQIETKGAWLASKSVPGWRIRLRRAGEWNKEYHAAVVRIMAAPGVAEYVAKCRADKGYTPTADERQLDAYLEVGAFAEGHVTDWDGVVDRKGEALPFTPESAVQLMAHFRPLLAECKAFAADPKNYAVSIDDIAGAAPGNS